MASNHHEDEVFVQKRRPKKPIKFNVQLNDEQKKAKALILDNPVTVLKGMAGSGKTLVATQVALDLLFTRQIDKIIITRPTVSKEDIGFLPGDIREKMDPWLAPIYHNLYMLYSKEKVDKEVICGDLAQIDLKDKRETGFAFLARLEEAVPGFVTHSLAQNHRHEIVSPILQVYKTFRD